MRQQLLPHSRAPRTWQDGFPLGNGRLGAMMWGDGIPSPSPWTTAISGTCGSTTPSRATRTSLRRLAPPDRRRRNGEGQGDLRGPGDPRQSGQSTKISIGRAEISLGAASSYRCSLDLGAALVSGALTTAQAKLPSRPSSIADATCSVCGSTPAPPRPNCASAVVAMCPALAKLNHPRRCSMTKAQRRSNPAADQPRRDELCGGWNPAGRPSSSPSPPPRTRTRRAPGRAGLAGRSADRVRGPATGTPAGVGRLLVGSDVYLPEPTRSSSGTTASTCWRFGPAGSATARPAGGLGHGRGHAAVARDYHADMNVQEIFWPRPPQAIWNCWTAGATTCERRSPPRRLTRRFFGTEGSFWSAARYRNTPRSLVAHRAVCVESYRLARLAGLAPLASQRGQRLVAETGYPVLAGIFRFYQANLEEERTDSSMYPSPAARSIARTATSLVPRSEHRPGADPPLLRLDHRDGDGAKDRRADRPARRVRERLAPYALTEAGALCLWPDKPLDESTGIQPPDGDPSAMDLTVEGTEEAAASSRPAWSSLVARPVSLAGHTYAQLISFAAVLGRAGWAYDSLCQLAEDWLLPNAARQRRPGELGRSVFRQSNYAPRPRPSRWNPIAR